jgi:probable F420-dependent oxidoreductase
MTSDRAGKPFPASPSVGIWVGSRVWLGNERAVIEAAPTVDDLGYSMLWLGGARGDLELIEELLAATRRIIVATGIVNIWRSSAQEVTESYKRIRDTYADRLLLGFGVGHATPDVVGAAKYVPPYSAMVRFLDELDSLPDPVPPSARVLAALGPRFLRLSADRASGAHPYLVTARHTREARETIGSGAFLAPELRVVLDEDPSRARQLARQGMARNFGMPNYQRSLVHQGRQPSDYEDGGSDALIDELAAWGDPPQVLKHIAAHHAAGADHVALQVLTGDDRIPLHEWRTLAGALYGG